jgi:hypothetical protein
MSPRVLMPAFNRGLSNISISNIANGAFAGLGSLTELCVARPVLNIVLASLMLHVHRLLSTNSISSIAKGSFSDLSSLSGL